MKRIKELRLSKGLSQAELAKILGYNQTAIGKYERGELEPSIATMEKLCDFFECSMPDKNNPNLAKTPQFSRFLSNARLKYVKYIFVRLCQKSSKISVFWSIAEKNLCYESDGEFLD